MKKIKSILGSYLNIDEFNAAGKEGNFCAYTLAKHISRFANVVLLPYGYLLADNIRKTLKIDW
jgi:hypothetical protein